MKEHDTRCPKCQRDGVLAVAVDALVQNPGPEGALHVIGCTVCGWTRSSVHYKGINRFVQLRTIVKESGEESMGRSSHDQSV